MIMSNLKIEIDMLDIGAADAILIHYFNENDVEYIVLIDAGNKNDGKLIIDHIKKYYKQDYIDLAICTHPDGDHINGFDYILDNMVVNEFWIHDPTNHIDVKDIRNNISKNKLEEKLGFITETLNNNTSLIDKIDSLGIDRKEPFPNLIHNNIPIAILGPDKGYYKDLLKRFRDIDLLINEESLINKNKMQDVSDVFISKTLDEVNDSSAENNSSVVSLFSPDAEYRLLFTGDAGPEALDRVIETYDDLVKNIDFLDVPHHGSKRSLTFSIINHFKPTTAFISGNGGRKYPSQAVVNTLKKVGTNVYSTHKGSSKRHHKGIGKREGYSTAKNFK